MNKKLVRCYRGEALGAQDRLEDVWFTMPDFGDCDRLYSCTSCGTLFVASPEAEHYSGVALQKRIEQFVCPEDFPPVKKLVRAVIAGGGKLLVCGHCAECCKIEKTSLVDGAKACTREDFLKLLQSGMVSLSY